MIDAYRSMKLRQGLKPKTVNNQLTVLRKSLAVARKWGRIDALPEVTWCKVTKPNFDYLHFQEAERLILAADGEWRTMILVALRTGLRLGELRALRWQDVDLKVGRLRVRQAVSRGVVDLPKSNRTREAPLSRDVVRALSAHRHLRGDLVFCQGDGKMLTKNGCKAPLKRACRRAGLRQVGWHVLRHTFASHLVQRQVPIRTVQELMGHATLEMTTRYAHLSPAVVRDAVNLLDQPAPDASDSGAGKQDAGAVSIGSDRALAALPLGAG